MSSGSTRRCVTNRRRNTTGMTWPRFKTLQRSECGPITMTETELPWTHLHQSGVEPSLPNVYVPQADEKEDNHQSNRVKTRVLNSYL